MGRWKRSEKESTDRWQRQRSIWGFWPGWLRLPSVLGRNQGVAPSFQQAIRQNGGKWTSRRVSICELMHAFVHAAYSMHLPGRNNDHWSVFYFRPFVLAVFGPGTICGFCPGSNG